MSDQNGVNPQRAQVPPRGRQSEEGGTSVGPRRARNEPRHTTPVAFDPTTSPVEQHWRKHPSDYHADAATDMMIASFGEGDSAKRSEQLALAQINATISLRDAVLEHAAVMRDIRDGKRKKDN